MKKCETCGSEARKIKRPFDLLQNIAAGLNKLEGKPVWNLEVLFYKDGEVVLRTGLPQALDYLANDIWWNEEGEWDDAEIAEVKTL